MKSLMALAACASVLALATQDLLFGYPLFIWNVTESVPIGLYRVVRGELRRGALVVVQLPDPIRAYAHARGYLPTSVLLIKPIAGLNGDMFCRLGALVLVNGRIIAGSHVLDGIGRALPRWQGCHRLTTTAVAVISGRTDSFDSRYFGPVDTHRIIGVAVPVWIAFAPPRL
jgi:conjugative transfer signal peptidase TraF